MRESENASYHPGKTAALLVRNKRLQFLEVHPDVTENYGIDIDCYIAEIDLDQLFEAAKMTKS